MRYFGKFMWEISDKLDIIINQLNSYTGDILVAIIGAIALIVSVFIGSKAIGKKLSEEQIKSKLYRVEESNRNLDILITEILLKIKFTNGPLHYKIIEKFYIEDILPLYKKSIESSVEVCTGCYIIERLTNYLLKFRIPHRYPSVKELRKVAHVDNNYFSYITNMLTLISFYTKESVSIPTKLIINKRLVDHMQKKLGGPNNNYMQNNVLTNISGIKYDTRFHLYSDFYNYIVRQGDDTVRAFVNIVDKKILFITSKYLLEHQIYAPLFFKINSNDNNYPYLFLSGIKFMHSLGNINHKTLQLSYINTLNWFYFENMINKELLKSEKIEYFDAELDKYFIGQANVIGTSSVAHTVRIDIQKKYSEDIFKDNKGRIFKKLHKNK